MAFQNHTRQEAIEQVCKCSSCGIRKSHGSSLFQQPHSRDNGSSRRITIYINDARPGYLAPFRKVQTVEKLLAFISALPDPEIQRTFQLQEETPPRPKLHVCQQFLNTNKWQLLDNSVGCIILPGDWDELIHDGMEVMLDTLALERRNQNSGSGVVRAAAAPTFPVRIPAPASQKPNWRTRESNASNHDLGPPARKQSTQGQGVSSVWAAATPTNEQSPSNSKPLQDEAEDLRSKQLIDFNSPESPATSSNKGKWTKGKWKSVDLIDPEPPQELQSENAPSVKEEEPAPSASHDWREAEGPSNSWETEEAVENTGWGNDWRETSAEDYDAQWNNNDRVPVDNEGDNDWGSSTVRQAPIGLRPQEPPSQGPQNSWSQVAKYKPRKTYQNPYQQPYDEQSQDHQSPPASLSGSGSGSRPRSTKLSVTFVPRDDHNDTRTFFRLLLPHTEIGKLVLMYAISFRDKKLIEMGNRWREKPVFDLKVMQSKEDPGTVHRFDAMRTLEECGFGEKFGLAISYNGVLR